MVSRNRSQFRGFSGKLRVQRPWNRPVSKRSGQDVDEKCPCPATGGFSQGASGSPLAWKKHTTAGRFSGHGETTRAGDGLNHSRTQPISRQERLEFGQKGRSRL